MENLPSEKLMSELLRSLAISMISSLLARDVTTIVMLLSQVEGNSS